jgi:hypothetical protein
MRVRAASRRAALFVAQGLELCERSKSFGGPAARFTSINLPSERHRQQRP